MTAPPLPTDDDDEAARRCQQHEKNDPFPKIPAALLNSSDVFNYVGMTGMVCPFDEKHLKSASYAIRIGKKVIHWDGKGELRERKLKRGERFELRPNSIFFIVTKEKFRLPPYIAMRFNLKINNVHRGLLLGTGPLVDPGFSGHLLVPLHNLTVNRYHFSEGDTFAWVEFTKVSPNSWDAQTEERYKEYDFHKKYKAFPDDKKDVGEWKYLSEAHNGPIRSSIPETLESAREAAIQAEDTVKFISVGGILALVLGAVSLWQGGTQLYTSLTTSLTTLINTSVADLRSEIDKVRSSMDEKYFIPLDARLKKLEEESRELNSAKNKK
jgi:deoxycytidine triphosphate deaminase